MKSGGRRPKPLIIVESPAKARTIEKALGRSYRVTASLGHLRDLPRSQLGVDVERDFEPKYITVRGRGPVVRELRGSAQKAGKVLLAADPDREGEAISWHLAQLLDLDPAEDCRIVFHEITKDALSEAVQHPRPIDMRLVDAQQARRVLDRLVGYGLSPLLWRKVRRGLSAGRVQSVALRLLCEREDEIERFVPQEYWTITAFLRERADGREPDREARAGGPGIEARLVGRVGADGKVERVEVASSGEAEAIVEAGRRSAWRVLDVRRGTRRRNPPPPFITSTLQQEAGNRLGFTVRRTMALAQQLYEGVDLGEVGPVGLITYMRTDATRVAEPARAQARALIREGLGGDYLPSQPPRHKVGKRAQGAHEAIRPTDPARTPAMVRPFLDRAQFRLYRLIWERFIASEMVPAVYATSTAEFEAAGWIYRATGSEVRFAGFLKAPDLSGVAGNGEDAEDDEPAGSGLGLLSLRRGQGMELVDILAEQRFTSPPPRYSEASLVKAMEELGIGRPSTYAPTIETIGSRGYVSREDGRLVPTRLGRVVNDLLLEHFPDVIDVAFTAGLEEQLDKVEEGVLPWRKVVRDFYQPFSESLQAAEKEMEEIEVPEEETGLTCDVCGRPMVVKYGRFGRFQACSGYPECRQTKPFALPTGVRCPKCGGEILEKRTRKGRRFYGCIRYPECDFSVWARPTTHQCPECGSLMLDAGRADDGPGAGRPGGNGPDREDLGPDSPGADDPGADHHGADDHGGNGPDKDGPGPGGPDGDGPGPDGPGGGSDADRPGRRLRCANKDCGYVGRADVAPA
ncbi:MAG: type I DNA topoisomerase [Bacillota bacterium]